MRVFFVLAALALAITVNGQDKNFTEITYTKQLSTQLPDSALLELKKMYDKATQQKDPLTMGTSLQRMGNICYYLGNYPQALDFHLRADKIFRELGRRELLAGNLNDMGILYYYNRQIALARKQYEEALSIYRQTKNDEGLAGTYGRIGHLYEKQHKYDSAFYFQRLALQQYSRISKKKGIAKIYENIGSIYEDLEKFDSARYYYQHSYDLYEQSKEDVSIIEVLNNLGDIYRKTGHYNEAVIQTRQALTLAKAANDLYEAGAAYHDLGRTYKLLNQNDSAYYYLELSRRATIDIYSAENNRQTAFLSVLFDIGKKNDEIVELQHARDINIIIAIATTIVILLLLVLGWVIISRQRLKIRNADILAGQNKQMHDAQQELMQTALENKQLLENKLVQDLEIKGKELTSHTLHVIQKNQLLEDLRNRLEIMAKDDKRDQKKQIQQLIQQINLNFNYDEYWTGFREIFEQVHQEFFAKLKERRDDLTYNDLRLAALIKLNLDSKDMATLLAISPDSLRVSKYRLKKKLLLEEGESLTSFINSL
ncbi:Tetratricopeptide repeat-containing protein [Chitinophaga sp. YR573]|uniref:tetratricopeptide repeat protein n=1 Tax=Chitinophaga sp. YR573 TaxID=1881040 RepID=UPI0008C17DC6|nr:tetratricopeptide repeat protein [Chitinophaga sp. YR573]SEW37873.1 Tetratricopeptide repeat-containing protein [Chitinophaga sp. YR573]